MGRESGQATVELLAAIPLLLLAGSVALQLLLAGYALTLADGAAEAGALAFAAGRPVKDAAADSLPAWAEDESEVSVSSGKVTVRLRPPSLFSAVSEWLRVASTSFVRLPGR
jgi:hypothetical protein